MMGLGEDVMWDGSSGAGSLHSFSSSNFLSGFGSRMTASFMIQPHVNLSGLCEVWRSCRGVSPDISLVMLV